MCEEKVSIPTFIPTQFGTLTASTSTYLTEQCMKEEEVHSILFYIFHLEL